MKNNENKSMLREIILNTVGNFAYLGALWLMSVLVVWTLDYTYAGVLSIAMTISNLFICVAAYTLRLFYASDINRKFSDNQYVFARILTTIVSLVATAVYTIAIGYETEIFICVLLFYIFKFCEMISDIYFGVLQRYGKLYLSGYTLVLKSILSIAVFAIVSFATKSLIAALIGLDIIGFVLLIVDVLVCKKSVNYTFKFDFSWKSILSILIICLPLCLVGVFFNVMPSVPKLKFERLYTTEELGYYSSISTICTLISTAVNSVIIPFAPKMTKYYQEDRSKFNILNIKIFIAILAFGALCFVLVLLLGDWGLSLIYGEEILVYAYNFKWIVIASVLTAYLITFNQIFISMNSTIYLMVGAIFGLITCLIIVTPLCKNLYMIGATLTLILSQGAEIMLLVVFLIIAQVMNKKKKQEVIVVDE